MDTLILDNSIETAEENTSPFMQRDIVLVNDTNQNYSSNSTVFETVSLSNNGRWNNFYEAWFVKPCVFVVTGKNTETNADINWTAAHISDSDLLLGIKNSNLNLINSCAIDYGNQQCTQASDYLNQYLIYKQHESMSRQDEYLNGSTIGYAKDSSMSWRYEAGKGICNNMNYSLDATQGCQNVKPVNEGMRKRQECFVRVDATGMGKDTVLGTIENLKKTGQNYVVNYTTHKVYFYNAVIRLRDLPVFSECGLMRGANFRISLTFNQCLFKVTKSTQGVLSFSQNNFQGKLTNPLMIAENKITTRGFSATDTETVNVVSKGGSNTIPNNTELTISCNIGKVEYAQHSQLNNITPEFSGIKLYVPSYVLKPDVQKRILALNQKKIVYNEVLTFVKTKQLGVVDYLITNGLPHMKRMIICPVLSASDNENISPHLSPFSTEPSTCSPYCIENFQVQVASKNIYHTAVNYSYDMFLTEVNGKYGAGHNVENGLSSSLISLQDFQNTYGYIVVDLKRKHTVDETTPLSVHMSCNIRSPKKLDFYIFIEVEKSFTYDVSTGQRLIA
jgi:hypothetical protein